MYKTWGAPSLFLAIALESFRRDAALKLLYNVQSTSSRIK